MTLLQRRGKAMRVIAAVTGGVLLLAFLAVVIVILIFDPNDYKDEMATYVKANTGRDIRFEGDLSLAFVPWFGLETGRIQLGNKPEFGPDPFASVDHAQVRVRLWPLLFKQVEVDTVKLDGVSVKLEQRAGGSNNWQDLMGSPPAATPPGPIEAKIITLSLPAFTVKGVEINPENLFADPNNRIGSAHIENAQVTLHDPKLITTQTLSGIDVTTGEVRLASLHDPIAVTLKLNVQSQAPPATAQVALAARVSADLAAKRYQLRDAELDVAFDVKQPAAQGSLKLSTDASFEQTTQKLALPNIKLNAEIRHSDGKQTTRAQLQSAATHVLSTQVLNVAPLELTATTQGEGLPAAGVTSSLRANVNANLNNETVALKDLVVKVANVDARGAVEADRVLSAPAYRGSLNVDPFDVRALLTQLGQAVPPITADPNALKKADLAVQFQGTATNARVDQLVMHLDDTTLNGTASIENFAKPSMRFDLALDKLDADRYQPPPQKAAEPAAPAPAPTSPGSAAVAGASELPLETLRALELDGSIKAGQLIASKLTVSDVNAVIAAKAGLIRVHPLRAKLYEGSYDGNITLDARGDKLKVTLDENLSDVQIGPIATVFLGKPAVEGRGSLKLKVATEGKDSQTWLRGLGGATSLNLRDGKVAGVDIAQVIADGIKLYKKDGQAGQDAGKNDLTRFASLAASATIENGTLLSRDLTLTGSDLTFSGDGKLDLISQGIDYTVRAIVSENAAEKFGKYLKDIKNVPIDGKISGTLRDPHFNLDVGGALERHAKQEVKQKIDEKKEEAVQKIEKKVEEKLKKFLGQ